MNNLVLVFGSLMAIGGIILLVRPAVLFDLLRKYQNSLGLYGLAIFVRVFLGVVLVVAAPASKFPLVLETLGWLAIVAAVFIGAIGRGRFSKLMAWVLGLAAGLGRISGLFAVLFGGFLVYATQ